MSVAAVRGEVLTVRAFTPGGLGVTIRKPALLPFGVKLRGDYITKGEYHIAKALTPTFNTSHGFKQTSSHGLVEKWDEEEFGPEQFENDEEVEEEEEM